MVNPNLQSKVVKTKFLTHFDAKNRVFGAKTPLFLTFPIELTNFNLRFGISVKNWATLILVSNFDFWVENFLSVDAENLEKWTYSCYFHSLSRDSHVQPLKILAWVSSIEWYHFRDEILKIWILSSGRPITPTFDFGNRLSTWWWVFWGVERLCWVLYVKSYKSDCQFFEKFHDT